MFKNNDILKLMGNGEDTADDIARSVEKGLGEQAIALAKLEEEIKGQIEQLPANYEIPRSSFFPQGGTVNQTSVEDVEDGRKSINVYTDGTPLGSSLGWGQVILQYEPDRIAFVSQRTGINAKCILQIGRHTDAVTLEAVNADIQRTRGVGKMEVMTCFLFEDNGKRGKYVAIPHRVPDPLQRQTVFNDFVRSEFIEGDFDTARLALEIVKDTIDPLVETRPEH